jgi:hypothetical protein
MHSVTDNANNVNAHDAPRVEMVVLHRRTHVIVRAGLLANPRTPSVRFDHHAQQLD